MPKDEGCIRYLMKEMDPSEEIEFEREMMGDEDLLIEVESLRKTLQKVDNIPKISPPSSLIESITNKAVHIRKNQIQKNNFILFNLNKNVAAAAAVLVISVSAISFHAFTGWNNDNIRQNNNASLNPVNTVQPWVDNNDILKYSDVQSNTADQLFFIEMAKSMEKLTPVEPESSPLSTSEDIMLTGSSY